MEAPPHYRAHAIALHDVVKAAGIEQSLNRPEAFHALVDEFVQQQWMMIFRQAKIDAVLNVLKKRFKAPRVIVELGGYVGKSALALAEFLSSFDKADAWTAIGREDLDDIQAQVYVLENDANFVKIMQDFAAYTGLSEWIQIIYGDAAESLNRLKKTAAINHIDVLLIDHWSKHYLPDLKQCERLGLLKQGSVVIADNTDFPGAPEYCRYMQLGGTDGYRYECESVDVGGEPGAAV